MCVYLVHSEIIVSFDGRDEYYAWGLHRIAKAVSFLNNDCKLVSIFNWRRIRKLENETIYIELH